MEPYKCALSNRNVVPGRGVSFLWLRCQRIARTESVGFPYDATACTVRIMNEFPTPTPYTFGSMSLGSSESGFDADIRIARRAMEAGVWFHSSPTYHRGFTYMVLRMAFDEARSQVPPMIIKIRDARPWLLRFEVEDCLRRLGIDRIAVAQLVQLEPGVLGRDFVSGGPLRAECEALIAEGKVGAFAPYLDRTRSDSTLAALEAGCFAGCTFYFNPAQRDVSDPVWELLGRRELPVLALRTLGGAFFRSAEGGAGEAATVALRGLLEEGGCRDLAELCMRYAWSFPFVRTTIGGTASAEHLDRFLEIAADPRPLPAGVVAKIAAMTAA
jgi:aryl-alcohol dehydrogenase-like predicted oxidoreductase